MEAGFILFCARLFKWRKVWGAYYSIVMQGTLGAGQNIGNSAGLYNIDSQILYILIVGTTISGAHTLNPKSSTLNQLVSPIEGSNLGKCPPGLFSPFGVPAWPIRFRV